MIRIILLLQLLVLTSCSVFFAENFQDCGDGVVIDGEQCDDANTTGGDGCSETCEIEACGDGKLDVGEQCDDGNVTIGDGCNADCLFEGCGNGVLEDTELCDDGNIVSGDGCSELCQVEACGDSKIDVGEQCDDGNVTPGDGCSKQCQIEGCGNNVAEDFEACDGSDLRGQSCESLGLGAGTLLCSPLCTIDTTNCAIVAFCGNNVVDTAEQCDNGTNNSDILPDACRSNCLFAHCGDSVLDSNEQCDDGNTNNGDGCDASCIREPVLTAAEATQIVVADENADGLDDIFFVANNQVFLSLQRPDTTFALATVLTIFDTNHVDNVKIQARDVDGDNRAELFVAVNRAFDALVREDEFVVRSNTSALNNNVPIEGNVQGLAVLQQTDGSFVIVLQERIPQLGTDITVVDIFAPDTNLIQTASFQVNGAGMASGLFGTNSSEMAFFFTLAPALVVVPDVILSIFGLTSNNLSQIASGTFDFVGGNDFGRTVEASMHGLLGDIIDGVTGKELMVFTKAAFSSETVVTIYSFLNGQPLIDDTISNIRGFVIANIASAERLLLTTPNKIMLAAPNTSNGNLELSTLVDNVCAGSEPGVLATLHLGNQSIESFAVACRDNTIHIVEQP